jgi:hypothetical protein
LLLLLLRWRGAAWSVAVRLLLPLREGLLESPLQICELLSQEVHLGAQLREICGLLLMRLLDLHAATVDIG